MVTKVQNSKIKRIITKTYTQLVSSFQEFSENTSLHAGKYFTKDNPLGFRKLFFALITLCTLAFCFYLIQLQLTGFEEKSIISSITTTAYPVWKVPFPSIIICNFNVVLKQAATTMMNIIKSHKINVSIFDDMTGNLSSLITTDELRDVSAYAEVYDLLQSIYSTDTLMSELAQPCERMLKQCYWKSELLPCSQIFRKVKTTQGFCCAFNHYGTFDSSGLIPREPLNDSLHFVGGTGPALGLRVVLDVEEDQYKSSIKPVFGFNVLVQGPTDFADMNLKSHSMEASEELTLSVTPKVYVSTDSIRSATFQIRRCLFDDEGNLEWSNVYNYNTCISACKARAIYRHCKCWPYYYPLITPLKICSLLDVPCLRMYKYDYSKFNNGSDDGDMCTCYPQCNEVTYSTHSDRAKTTQMQDFFNTNYSILNVHYGTVGCHRTEKDVYNTWVVALSSVGGILGICVGGSIITIIEVVFFTCQWIIYTCCKRQSKNQKNIRMNYDEMLKRNSWNIRTFKVEPLNN